MEFDDIVYMHLLSVIFNETEFYAWAFVIFSLKIDKILQRSLSFVLYLNLFLIIIEIILLFEFTLSLIILAMTDELCIV